VKVVGQLWSEAVRARSTFVSFLLVGQMQGPIRQTDQQDQRFDGLMLFVSWMREMVRGSAGSNR